MVSARQFAIFLFIYSIACASAAALPTSSANLTTHELTERQILHLGDDDDFWCDRIEFKDYNGNGCSGPTYYSGAKPAEITKTTNIKSRKSGDSVLKKGSVPTIRDVCDLVLPPSFVLERLRKSGACKKAADDRLAGTRTMTAMLAKLQVATNSRFLQKQRLVDFKTKLVQKSGSVLPSSVPPSKLEKLQVMAYMLSLNHPTLAIAKAIDAEMLSKYTVRPNIESDWNALMRKIFDKYVALEEEISREIECMGGSSRPGSPMDTSLWRKRSRKIEARFLGVSDSTSYGVSTMPLSGLNRRARAAAARSGPKAAPAPSCPLKKPPPKKTVPRSKAQPKPKPAVKPRKPAKAPQPRKPSPTKKVAARPATRARRTPGKAAPRKRTTPKVKPRVVPKPTRKPKGKPRPRRRK